MSGDDFTSGTSPASSSFVAGRRSPRTFIAALVVGACVLLATGLLVPWAYGYGPGQPGVLSPAQRPILPGIIDSVYLIGGAIFLALVSLLISRWRGAVLLGAFTVAALPCLWVAAFIVDPNAFGGTALGGSGFVAGAGSWLTLAGVVMLGAALVTTAAGGWLRGGR